MPINALPLNAWPARPESPYDFCCVNGTPLFRAIRNPAGYLFGIISKALRHEFNLSRAAAPAPVTKPTTSTPAKPAAAPEVAHAHLAHLRKLLGILPGPDD